MKKIILFIALLSLPLGTAFSQGTPTVLTHSAVDVSLTQAKLVGSFDTQGKNDAVVTFWWGISTKEIKEADLSVAPTKNVSGAGSYEYVLTNLSPGTQYVFRIVLVYPEKNFVLGDYHYFTTQALPPQETPLVETLPAQNITQTSATLKGFFDGKNNTTINPHFEWGSQAGDVPLSFIGMKSASGSNYYEYTLPNLIPGITYIFRAIIGYGEKNAVVGEYKSFTTNPLLYPKIKTQEILSIGSTDALLKTSFDTQGRSDVTVGFQWGVSTKELTLSSTPTKNVSGIGSYEHMLSGLSPNTKYVFRAILLYPEKNFDLGKYQYFTTGALPQKPVTETKKEVQKITPSIPSKNVEGEKTQELSEKHKEKIVKINTQANEKLNTVSSRLKEFANKINTHIVNFESRGIDMTESQSLLSSCRTKIDLLEKAYATMNTTFSTVSEKTNISEAEAAIQSAVRDVVVLIKDAHGECVATVEALRRALKTHAEAGQE